MKKTLTIVLALMMACICLTAFGEEWPTSRSVELVTPLSAGGGTDLYARLLTEQLTKATGTNFVVNNQTAGGGAVAYNQIANGPADGSQLLVCTTSLFTSYLSGTHNLNPLESFRVFSVTYSQVPHYIVVPKDSPWSTIGEFVEYAKENPKKIVFGMQIGSASHFVAQSAMNSLGIEVRFVESGSDGDRMKAVLGNIVQASLINGTTTASYAASGDIKVLACVYTMDPELKLDAVKDVPSLAEAGYQDVDVVINIMFMAPKSVSDEVLAIMQKTFYEAEVSEELQAKVKEMNMPMKYFDTLESTQGWNEKTFHAYEEAAASMGLGK